MKLALAWLLASLALAASAEDGILLLHSVPEDCEISEGGVVLGHTPRLISDLDASKPHVLKLSKTGYLDSEIEVRFDGRRPLYRQERLQINSGTIQVKSDPDGAEVIVNGVSRGQTPLTADLVPVGPTLVEVRLAGFQTEKRTLKMAAGMTESLVLLLQGLPGTLKLVSVPEGARFYVDDVFRGLGPLSIPNLKPGDHRLRAEMQGYATIDRSVFLANGASATEEFKLSNVMGKIEVRSSPVGAKVFLDGRLVGETSSSTADAETSDVLTIDNVLAENDDGTAFEHQLKLTKDGYGELVRKVRVGSGKISQQHRCVLKKLFIPNIEVTTETGVVRGILKNQNPAILTIEIKPGIEQAIKRTDIKSTKVLLDK